MTDWGKILGEMLGERWFWGGLILIVLLWYSTVTVYVAVKGIGDIRSMLRTLNSRASGGDRARPPSPDRPSSTEGNAP